MEVSLKHALALRRESKSGCIEKPVPAGERGREIMLLALGVEPLRRVCALQQTAMSVAHLAVSTSAV